MDSHSRRFKLYSFNRCSIAIGAASCIYFATGSGSTFGFHTISLTACSTSRQQHRAANFQFRKLNPTKKSPVKTQLHLKPQAKNRDSSTAFPWQHLVLRERAFGSRNEKQTVRQSDSQTRKADSQTLRQSDPKSRQSDTQTVRPEKQTIRHSDSQTRQADSQTLRQSDPAGRQSDTQTVRPGRPTVRQSDTQTWQADSLTVRLRI